MKKILGQPIVDALTMCYNPNEELLNRLKNAEMGECLTIDDYSLQRVPCQSFQYDFELFSPDSNDKVVDIRFWGFGEFNTNNYLYLTVANYVLYNHALLYKVISIPKQLGMTFHHFTSIDIAVDAKKDMALFIKRMWHRKDITTLINGRAILERKEILKNVSLQYGTTLERQKYLTIYIKQAKAVKDKAKGIIVKAYNKGVEIETSSQKKYIAEYYGFPSRLYRLEINLRHHNITEYCRRHNIYEEEKMIFNEQVLTDMFYHYLSALIRFRKGRKIQEWKSLIECIGRTR